MFVEHNPSGLRRVLGILLLIGAGVAGYCLYSHCTEPAAEAPPPSSNDAALFASWPKDAKPEAVIILSGQTFGYVQPCGCSRPQKGGLERRANFIDSLRKKGWPVAGVDLGDVYPDRHPLGPPPISPPPEESLLKYKTTMNALREMGYIAVGVGKTEFAAGLSKLTAEYALQKEQPPYTLAGNVVGLSDGKVVPRDQFFPAPGASRPLVGLAEIAKFENLSVGIVGVVGKGLDAEASKLDPSIKVEGAQKVLERAVKQLAAAPKPPAINVLLYQGPVELARAVAKDRPEFQVILCQSDDSEPPLYPEYFTQSTGAKTMIVQVGHKGRYVGVVGAFKTAKGIELKYQLVSLGEGFITPMDPASEKANKVLSLLELFAIDVKRDRFLEKIVPVPHPAQIQSPKLNLTFVGSEKCVGCHAAESKKWSESKHAHAMDALEKIAKRPGLRNLDPECVVCHTVGFGFKTGYETAEKTPLLKHVGCETCHGPGSGHAAAERNETLLKYLSPWKQAKTDRLPDLAIMAKLADPAERGKVALPAAQLRVANAVSAVCRKCHDGENDPHFDLYTYWPKIVHSGLGKK